MYGLGVGISVWDGSRDQCMGWVYGISVWDGSRDQCMGWV